MSLESSTGIKYSILTELPYFNPIQFTIVDPMHNLFLGTAKHMMKIWMERNLITKDQMRVIQTRVDLIQVPSDIGRIPKKISSSFHCRAMEKLGFTILHVCSSRNSTPTTLYLLAISCA